VARKRTTRAINNDVAIREATIALILSVGVDRLAFRDIATSARLTHGALYARFEDVEELLVDLWSSCLEERAASLFDAVAQAVATPDSDSVAQVMDRVRRPTPDDIAMITVLWTSRRLVILHEEVESFLHDRLETMEPAISEVTHSRTLCLFSFVILALFATYQSTLTTQDLDCFQSTILQALLLPSDDVDTLNFAAPIVRELPYPESGLREQLAYHTFVAVGRSGFSRATISRISRRARCSPGAIYKIYPSKEELIIGAVKTNMTAPWIRIATFANILEPGALAHVLYSAASPQNNVRKDFTLEVAMASAHNEKLRAATLHQMRELETVVAVVSGLNDDDVIKFKGMIRFIIFATMGVSYLSTLTKAAEQIDFNQFAEPVRRALLTTLVPMWPTIRDQLDGVSSATRDGEVSQGS
jgi:AcrR family transcriptional regulator